MICSDGGVEAKLVEYFDVVDEYYRGPDNDACELPPSPSCLYNQSMKDAGTMHIMSWLSHESLKKVEFFPALL